MKAPRVSALVPSYNHRAFVGHAVESALGQRGVEHEVVVVDDASTDGTREILEGLSGEPRLRLEFAERNRGVSATFNRCLELAQGEFVAYLGSDDWWLPGHLAGAVECLEHEGAAMVYGKVRVVDEQDRETDGAPELFHSVPGDEFFAALMRGGNFVPFISAVMRRDTVRSLGGFDEELVTFQDYDLWIRIAARHPVLFRDEVAGAFRWHGANTSGPSRENSARFRRETVHILEKALRELPQVEQGGHGAVVRRRLAASYRQLGHRTPTFAERASCYRNSLRLDPYQPETVCRYLATRVREALGARSAP